MRTIWGKKCPSQSRVLCVSSQSRKTKAQEQWTAGARFLSPEPLSGNVLPVAWQPWWTTGILRAVLSPCHAVSPRYSIARTLSSSYSVGLLSFSQPILVTSIHSLQVINASKRCCWGRASLGSGPSFAVPPLLQLKQGDLTKPQSPFLLHRGKTPSLEFCCLDSVWTGRKCRAQAWHAVLSFLHDSFLHTSVLRAYILSTVFE